MRRPKRTNINSKGPNVQPAVTVRIDAMMPSEDYKNSCRRKRSVSYDYVVYDDENACLVVNLDGRLPLGHG